MNRKIFETCVGYFNHHATARCLLFFIYKVMPLLMFVAYPVLLYYSLRHCPQLFPRLVAVPLGVYLGVTVMRIAVNEQRPYERYGKPSVFRKTTKGKSFPSRHTASAVIIAMAFFYVSVPLGVVALWIALLIEVSRILAGAHYIHDVVCGMLLSLAAGIVFYFVI